MKVINLGVETEISEDDMDLICEALNEYLPRLPDHMRGGAAELLERLQNIIEPPLM